MALSHLEAEKWGLPPAQDWPWDTDRGIYLVNGFHQMHCLVGPPVIPSPQSSLRNFNEGLNADYEIEEDPPLGNTSLPQRHPTRQLPPRSPLPRHDPTRHPM